MQSSRTRGLCLIVFLLNSVFVFAQNDDNLKDLKSQYAQKNETEKAEDNQLYANISVSDLKSTSNKSQRFYSYVSKDSSESFKTGNEIYLETQENRRNQSEILPVSQRSGSGNKSTNYITTKNETNIFKKDANNNVYLIIRKSNESAHDKYLNISETLQHSQKKSSETSPVLRRSGSENILSNVINAKNPTNAFNNETNNSVHPIIIKENGSAAYNYLRTSETPAHSQINSSETLPVSQRSRSENRSSNFINANNQTNHFNQRTNNSVNTTVSKIIESAPYKYLSTSETTEHSRSNSSDASPISRSLGSEIDSSNLIYAEQTKTFNDSNNKSVHLTNLRKNESTLENYLSKPTNSQSYTADSQDSLKSRKDPYYSTKEYLTNKNLTDTSQQKAYNKTSGSIFNANETSVVKEKKFFRDIALSNEKNTNLNDDLVKGNSEANEKFKSEENPRYLKKGKDNNDLLYQKRNSTLLKKDLGNNGFKLNNFNNRSKEIQPFDERSGDEKDDFSNNESHSDLRASAEASASASASAEVAHFPSTFPFPTKPPHGSRPVGPHEEITPSPSAVKCTSPGTLHYYWENSNCYICTCVVRGFYLVPVCASCNVCQNVFPPSTQHPEHTTSLTWPTWPPPTEPTWPPTEPTGPTTFPPGSTTSRPTSCSPLPVNEKFTNPLNFCQECVCSEFINEQGLPDVSITCELKPHCATTGPPITTTKPIFSTTIEPNECDIYPPSFEHPLYPCMICRCVIVTQPDGSRLATLYCVPNPKCVSSTVPPSSTPEGGSSTYPTTTDSSGGTTSVGPPTPPPPPPHKSCYPYKPKELFQHPWDECQLCVCYERKQGQATEVEVHCHVKPECCYIYPNGVGAQPPVLGLPPSQVRPGSNRPISPTAVGPPVSYPEYGKYPSGKPHFHKENANVGASANSGSFGSSFFAGSNSFSSAEANAFANAYSQLPALNQFTGQPFSAQHTLGPLDEPVQTHPSQQHPGSQVELVPVTIGKPTTLNLGQPDTYETESQALAKALAKAHVQQLILGQLQNSAGGSPGNHRDLASFYESLYGHETGHNNNLEQLDYQAILNKNFGQSPYPTLHYQPPLQQNAYPLVNNYDVLSTVNAEANAAANAQTSHGLPSYLPAHNTYPYGGGSSNTNAEAKALAEANNFINRGQNNPFYQPAISSPPFGQGGYPNGFYPVGQGSNAQASGSAGAHGYGNSFAGADASAAVVAKS